MEKVTKIMDLGTGDENVLKERKTVPCLLPKKQLA